MFFVPRSASFGFPRDVFSKGEIIDLEQRLDFGFGQFACCAVLIFVEMTTLGGDPGGEWG
jgi:hypothetical protein